MGKKAKSKKQLEEELKKVYEEQRHHEERERLKNVEEDLRAKHSERLAAELDGRDRVLEAERLEEESTKVSEMKGERRRNLEYEQSKLQDQINWQKFIACNSRPNVAYEYEIETYLTMSREEKVNKMEDAMRKCHESEELVGDLMELYCKAREDGDVARQDWCMHYIRKIRALEVDQIDEATSYLLQYIEKQEVNTHLQVYLSWGAQNDDIKVGFWGHLQSKGFRAKQIDHPKIQIGLDLPKSIALQSMGQCIGVRTFYTTFDNANSEDGSQMSVGGMIRVDLLSIPPFSKRVKTWTIRQVPSPGHELMRLPYPNTEQHSASTAIAAQPCKIEYKVPANVLVPKNPTVSWWDASEKKWSTEGITEISWESEMRKIAFFSQRLAAFSMTQERHLDLPYDHWSIRPTSPVTAELTLQAKRYELHFIISEDGLRLKGVRANPGAPGATTELKDVMYNKAIGEEDEQGGGAGSPGSPRVIPAGGRVPRVQSPARLLTELRDCGLNLLPVDGDAEFLEGYTPKCTETQARAYDDLSEIAASYEIASSKHNKHLPPEKALVRVRESDDFYQFDPLDPDCDTDYQAVLFWPDKSGFVQSMERVSPVSETAVPDNVTHASLYLTFDKRPSPGPAHAEQLRKLEVTCTNVRFVESVRQTMQLMRLLCFV
jgi:hypothetical protein